MPGTFRNLFYVLKKYKLATIVNLLGLTLAFSLFIVICIHVNHEYEYNSSIANKERIFQFENLRNDGIWEANFSRPQLERFIAGSPHIEAAAITNNLVYMSFRFAVSTSTNTDATSYMELVERITPDYTKVFNFEIIAGSADCMKQPDGVLISEKMAEKYFGQKDPIGKQLHFFEFKDLDKLSIYGLSFRSAYTIGGVYRDFPENMRVKNALYIPIPEKEMMDDWNTGSYYCYLLLSSPEAAPEIAKEYMEKHREFLKNFAIMDLRLRALPELYFGQQVRADAAPTGNKLRTDMLLFIAILIIGIALANYINLSIALAPVRTKSITTQKVLGSSNAMLRRSLVYESLGMSLFALTIALFLIFIIKDISLIKEMLGHSLDLSSNLKIIAWTFALVAATSILAGIYPAFYTTSFPPAMALNGSFSLSSRAKNTRKILMGFQFMISITLIISSLFVLLQNKYIGTVNLGYQKENILEARLSMGTAMTKSDLFKSRLLENPNIKDVAFIQFKFVSDENRPLIGYNYKNEHYYMSWLGISPNLPELMDIKIIAGRNLRPEDEAPNSILPVCVINETAAREIASRFSKEEIKDISDLIGTSIKDNNDDVQIVGIFSDIHYESLYKEIRPLGLWTSAKGHYRRNIPESYAYIKISGGDARTTIQDIKKVVNELNPGYSIDIHFFDKALDELYSKSHQQGVLVAVLCLLAVILSLVGVFGLVIFESQGREKEIAVRRVFGSTIGQILWMFNSSFIHMVLVSFVLSSPLAYYGVTLWLQSFAYKTPLHLWVFLIALLIILILTVLTVTFQSYRTATANPAPKL